MHSITAARATARAAGLRYICSDSTPGIRRKKRGKSFVYFHPNGRPVTDDETKIRIHCLVVPPAWRDVWICPFANGHLQATGRDAAGRKQHRYHAKFRAARDQSKYLNVISFARALPKIHRACARDLRQKKLSRQRVLALVVELLEKTLIRVGNEEYANDHHHFGLTTMRDAHAHIAGGGVVFDFTGKSGVHRHVKLIDGHLARIVKACQHLPGRHLFRYRDDAGRLHDVTSTDVNEYLRAITNQDITAKDFRTWAGTILAARALSELVPFETKKEARKNVVRAVASVASQLGNTPAVCRKCYIHPAILNAYLNGSLGRGCSSSSKANHKHSRGISAERAAVLRLLESQL